MNITRSIESSVENDLAHKMVLIAGPRQAGKTFLAKRLLAKNGYSVIERYLNWDRREDRMRIGREAIPFKSGMIVFDELHKYRHWRQIIKGLFDKFGPRLRILVTGSARLDHYRRGGDSLQGRYHFHRLLPFTLSEVGYTQKKMDRLLERGGFPEPFLAKTAQQARRWSREYRTRIVRDELRDLQNVRDIDLVGLLYDRLPELVGSPLSLTSIREDLQVTHQTVLRWVSMLENLYALFRISPFGPPKIRAVKKEAKHYHYDWTLVTDMGSRFENMVAVHLLKWTYMQDVEGYDAELRYFRDVDGREVDFILLKDKKPIRFIEVKLSDTEPSRALRYLKSKYPDVESVQIVKGGDVDTVSGDIRVVNFIRFMEELETTRERL